MVKKMVINYVKFLMVGRNEIKIFFDAILYEFIFYLK